MVRIAVVENDQEYIDVLSDYIQTYMKERGLPLDLKVFRDGSHITFDYKPVYDIIFMDIEMPGMDGMTAAEKIRKVHPDVTLIFVTNMAQYAVQGYKVRARSYLLKPVNYYSFAFELEEAVDALSLRQEDYLLVTGEEGFLKLGIGSVCYVESQLHHAYIHTRDEVIQIRESMKNLESRLSKFYFCRCHVSYLVNLAYVSGVYGNTVKVGKDEVPVSRQKRSTFMEALTHYIGGNLYA